MKKSVVTGACGFIGKEITKKLLHENIIVYAIVTEPDNLKDIVCENLFIIKSYFDEYMNLPDKLPNDIDVFYHFAWQGVFGEAFKDYALQLSNAKYACDALMVAINIRAKKFVLASTVNTLETRKYFNLDFFKPRYTNIYATAKLSAEMIGKTIAYNKGIEFNTGIIAMVYGENNKSRMLPNVVMSNLIYNRESNLIDGNTLYDMIHVTEVADAFYHIGIEGINQKTYYVGHANLRTIKDMFNEIRKIINPDGILNYGFYQEDTSIDYSLIELDSLSRDTSFIQSENFSENIIRTANWIKESGEFK